MTLERVRSGVLVVALLACLPACGGSTGGPPPKGDKGMEPDYRRALGTEGGDCFPNHTCNSGLVCLSNLCVRLPDRGIPDVRRDVQRPDLLASDMSPRDGSVDAAKPDAGVPDLAQPDSAQPDLGMPDTAVTPDLPSPDLPAPDSASPDLPGHDLAIPDLPKPDAAPAVDVGAPQDVGVPAEGLDHARSHKWPPDGGNRRTEVMLT